MSDDNRSPVTGYPDQHREMHPPKIDAAALIYRLGEDLWYAVACLPTDSVWASTMRNLMNAPAPGDPVIVAFTLRQSAADLVGTLVSRTEEPYPDWDEEANGEPSPTRPVWTIETLDGRLVRWENVEVRRLPVRAL